MIATSTHTVVFSHQSSNNWSTYSEVNALFIENTRRWLNDQLKMRGHAFVNDVHDALGVARTSKGATDGWLWSSDNPQHGIAFDMTEPDEDGTITITLHTDGVIYDKIEKTP